MENPISGDERRAQEVLELTDDSECTSAKNDEGEGGDTNEDMEGTGEDDDEMDEDASSSLSAGDDLIVRSILSNLFSQITVILAGRLGRRVRR